MRLQISLLENALMEFRYFWLTPISLASKKAVCLRKLEWQVRTPQSYFLTGFVKLSKNIQNSNYIQNLNSERFSRLNINCQVIHVKKCIDSSNRLLCTLHVLNSIWILNHVQTPFSDNIRLPKSAVLGGEEGLNRGFQFLMHDLGRERLILSIVCACGMEGFVWIIIYLLFWTI